MCIVRLPRCTATALLPMSLLVVSACSLSSIAPLPPPEPARSVTTASEVVSRGDLLFEGSLNELFPCHDGDMVAYRVEGGPRSGGIMVSRTFALPKAGDFRVTNSFSDTLTEALHLRTDGTGISVISQVDAEQDVGVTYAQPLPLTSVPLYAGVSTFRSPVRIWRPSSGRTMGDGEVSLTVTAAADSIEGYDKTYSITQAGTFKLLKQQFELRSTAWLSPGLGEVRGRRVQPGAETETYTLVCARIDGKDVVDCAPFASEIGK